MPPNHLIGISSSKFLERVHSTINLKRVRDFHDDSHVIQICQTERRRTLEILMKSISYLDMNDICELVKNADAEIRECTKNIMMKNQEHRKKSESILEHVVNYLVNEFESSVFCQLSLEPYIELEKLQKILEQGHEDVMRSFQDQWKPGNEAFQREFEKKLECEIECIRKQVIDHQERFLKEVEKEERNVLNELVKTSLDKLEHLETTVQSYDLKGQMCEVLRNMKIFICQHEEFFKNEYRQAHYELFEMVQKAETDLRENPEKLAQDEVMSLVEDLKLKIQNVIMKLEESNEEKEARIQNEVKALMAFHLQQYSIHMEDFLEESNGGFEPRRLEREHKGVSKRLENSLEFDIRRISFTEDTQGHCSGLLDQIEKHWSTVKLNSEEKIKTAKKLKEEEKLTYVKTVAPIIPVADSDPVVVEAIKPECSKDPVAENQLVFKISRRHVTMGAAVDGTFQILNDKSEEAKIPFLVCKNKYGELQYGKQAAKYRSSQDKDAPIEHWWITDYFGTSSFGTSGEETKFKVALKDYSCELSIEFLLGYFLGRLKDNAERELKVKFASAIITIPLWFCSMHRIKIKDAAKIAGFTDCRLFNEESAAAYAYHLRQVKTTKERKRGEYFLILSENFDVVTATLYNVYLNKFGKEDLSMDAFHFGDGSLKKYITTSAMEFVQSVCNAALEKDEHPPTNVIFLTEEPVWLNAFQLVAKEKGLGDGLVVSEGILLGALRERYEGIRKCFLETMPLDIYKENLTWIKGVDLAIPEEKSQYVSLESEAHEVKLEYGQRETRYFQKSVLAMNREVTIGKLWIGRSVYVIQNARPVFDISCEGIVTLKEVKVISDSTITDKKEEVITDFTWATPNMDDEKRNKLSEMIHSFVQAQSLREELLSFAKQMNKLFKK